MPTILTLNGLSKIYRKGNIEIPALRDVSFELEKGAYLSIVGKSGSGKSTLLNLVGGLDRPTSGRIRVNGEELGSMTRYQLAMHRRYAIGMIFQSFNLIPNRTALDNIVLPLIFSGIPRRERKPRAMELLEQVGLPSKLGWVGVKEDAIPMLAQACFQLKRLMDLNPRDLNVASIEEIYRKAL